MKTYHFETDNIIPQPPVLSENGFYQKIADLYDFVYSIHCTDRVIVQIYSLDDNRNIESIKEIEFSSFSNDRALLYLAAYEYIQKKTIELWRHMNSS